LKLVILPAKLEEVLWISSRLRPEDQNEVETATGKPVKDVLLKAFSLSRSECYTLRFNHEREPVAIFGVAEQDTIGVPWFLATPDVTRGALSILREAPRWLDKWLLRYPSGLVNIVDSRNALHLRWIEAIGCSFGGTNLRNGVPFLFFYYN